MKTQGIGRLNSSRLPVLRCRSISFPEWKCDGIDEVKPKDGRRNLIGVEIEG